MAGLQGRVFGGYQLAEQLPSGGIAEVYRARPSKPGGREVVVKVIYPEFARQPGFLPKFRGIVESCGKLKSHPHILPLLANGEEGGYLYLVTPFVADGTLKDWLYRGGRMGAGDVGPFFRQLCDALSYAHSLGVVHGNIKPSNVYLYEGRHVMLGDFGLLWDVGHLDMEQAGSGMEVVEYLAPEVAQGQVSQQADIYSVGAVLFASLTGQAPFRGARPSDVFAAHARQPVPPVGQVNVALPPPMRALDAVIQRAMAKSPDQRYPSAGAVAQAVEATLRQAGAAQSAPAAGFAQSPGAGQPFVPVAGMAGMAAMPGLGGAPGQPIPGLGGAPGQPMPAPALGPVGAAPGLAPLGQLGGMPALGALGAGIGGVGLGGAGFGGAGPGMQAPSIKPLGPPFPPLPASALVDESMEQGRISARSAESNQLGAPGAGFGDGGAPLLPTAQMPAPVLPPQDAGPATAATMRVPAPAPINPETGQPWDGQQLGPGAAGPEGRGGLLSVARPRSGLGKRLGQMSGGPPLGADMDGADGAGQEMPAVRAPGMGAQPPGGFRVSGGGTDPRRAAAGAVRGMDEAGTQEEVADGGWGGAGQAWSDPLTDGFSDLMPSVSHDAPDPAGWSASGEYVTEGGGRDGPSFSPTQLGLPRLTSPALGAMPPSWQEILSGQMPAIQATGRGPHPDPADDLDALVTSLPHAPWRSSPNGEAAEWAGESAAWASPNSGAIGWEPRPEAQPPLPATSGPWSAVESPMGPIHVPNAPARANRPAPEDDLDLIGDMPTGMVRKLRAPTFRRRRPWVRRLAVLVLLLALLDAAGIVVLRPDLCPNTACQMLHDRVRPYLPFLNGPANPTPTPPLTADPSDVKVSVPAGKSGSAQITLTNMTGAPLTWTATSTVPWLTFSPTSGTIPADSSALLTAKVSASSLKTGSYAASIAVAYGKQALTIPVTVAVTNG